MTQEPHEWLVFHRVRFAAPVDGNNTPFPGPTLAQAWRFYPAAAPGTFGRERHISDEWGGFGIYASRQDAETVYENPQDHLSFLPETVEAYHALIVPHTHRGKVNWRGEMKENTSIATAPSDPGGPLVIFTSAGYDNPGPDDLPRITKFVRDVDRVLAYYATLPDNIRRAAFNGNAVDAHDGLTVTIWRSDAAMMQAAYKPGEHRDQLDYQNDKGHFDRSSFTRARIMASKGTWDGTDPVQDIA